MTELKDAAPSTSRLDAPLRTVAVGLPFALAIARASTSGQWRDDLPAVRDLGLVAVGIGGGLSTLLTQLLSLVPLGSRAFRASVGSSLALGVAAWLLFGMALRALREPARARQNRRLAPLLAAIATLTAALSPTWQREATVGGGAMLATASALAVLELAMRSFPRDGPLLGHGGASRWVGLGALLGATFAESPAAAVVAAVSATVLVLASHLRLVPRGASLLGRFGGRFGARFRATAPPPSPPQRPGFFPTRRTALAAALAFAVTAALLLAPLALRPLAPRARIDIGRALSTVSLSALDVAAVHTSALAAWISEIGAVSLAIAALGAAAGLVRSRGRAPVAALLALVAADALAPASLAGALSADPLMALRSLALAAIAIASALGVHAIVLALRRASFPMAKAAAVLVVVFHLTLVALTSEEAGFVADRSEQLAAEEWADQALAALEPRAVVMVRSPALAWRLWAARLTRGERPDVLIVPLPLLDRGRVAADLAAADPSLEPLLRDFALVGEPSEFALSKLADGRPLHVEMDRRWSRRLVAHLAVDGMWLEYAPQPLGASDRRLASAVTLAPMRRVINAARAAVVPDASTGAVIASTLRDQAEVLTLLGEREAAGIFIARVGQLAPTDPLSGAGWLRLAFAGLSAAPGALPGARAPGKTASRTR